MKTKLQALISLANRQHTRIAIPAIAILAGVAAHADTADPLGAAIDALISGVMTGVGTTFAKIVPLLVLVFGMGFAWRWVKKGAK
ncbi:hypothetical protein [Chitinimonas naiadis]